MTTTLKCLRCGRDGHLPADCKVPVLPDDRVLATQADALTIAADFKRFAQDHGPDGWPAVQQRQLSEAAAMLLNQHERITYLDNVATEAMHLSNEQALRITALEAEVEALRFELQTARDVNLAVVNRQQAEIADLKKKLHTARKDEADALLDRDRVYEAQERAGDAYRAGSSGY